MTTNYENITESSEKLAEFIDEVTDICSDKNSDCDKCPLWKACASINSVDPLVEWMNEEYKDGESE